MLSIRGYRNPNNPHESVTQVIFCFSANDNRRFVYCIIIEHLTFLCGLHAQAIQLYLRCVADVQSII